MSLSSQFSLSLEVTRIVPFGLLASKGAEAVMNLARDLQSSGSDIVVEEDLAGIFGRCRISPNMDTSFRTIVTKQGFVQPCEGMSLESGPGPTVLRSLTQPPYFAMVLQCSLLTWVHERTSLSTSIAQIFEKQNAEAPLEHVLRAIPSQEGILGVLTACEEQTSSYEWTGHIRAVANMLDVPEEKAFKPLPSVIIRGAVYMFPLVQTLPEDRFIVAELNNGMCFLVVWAHNVLGLTVLVRKVEHGKFSEKKFGTGVEQLIIVTDVSLMKPSITLLETSSKENMITLSPDPDESAIDGIVKRPAKGYGREWMQSLCNMEGSEALVEEMKLISSAFAVIIGENIFPAFGSQMTPIEEDDDVNHALHEELPIQTISEKRLLDAAKLLFNDDKLKGSAIRKYADFYAKKPLSDRTLEPPRILSAVVDHSSTLDQEGKRSLWKSLVSAARSLSVLILAFTHVQDLASCEKLLLCNSYDVLYDHVLVSQLHTWDGESGLRLPEDVWFLTIAKLMIGHREEMRNESVSLISDRGWSIYLCTFGIADPSFVDPGSVRIEKGVPCRQGVRKHKVIDGPSGGFDSRRGFGQTVRDKASLSSPRNIVQGRMLCGDRFDSFVVNIRITLLADEMDSILRTGYRELARALWMVTKTNSCQHYSRRDDTVELPIGCVAVAGFWEWVNDDLEERVVISLTANNTVARWRALVAAANGRNRPTSQSAVPLKHVLLRGPNCCLQCSVDQALTKDGRCILVL